MGFDVKSKGEVDFYLKHKIEKNVECIKNAKIQETEKSDELQLRLYIDKDSVNNWNELNQHMTFFELFGFGEEFKQLFNLLNDITTTSKKEISHTLRHEMIGSIFNTPYEIMFITNLSKSSIIY
jgi:hypothetical protein